MKGHLNFMLNNLTEASSCYERCLVYEEQPTDLNRVYTRLAIINLKLEKVMPSYCKFLFDFSYEIVP